MQRGLNRGWLDAAEFEPRVERAFRAVSVRTDENGAFIDVSESTNKQPSLEAYLMREALFGRDPRTGSFAMLFAVERARWREEGRTWLDRKATLPFTQRASACLWRIPNQAAAGSWYSPRQ